jgi:hypothetical protein
MRRFPPRVTRMDLEVNPPLQKLVTWNELMELQQGGTEFQFKNHNEGPRFEGERYEGDTCVVLRYIPKKIVDYTKARSASLCTDKHGCLHLSTPAMRPSGAPRSEAYVKPMVGCHASGGFVMSLQGPKWCNILYLVSCSGNLYCINYDVLSERSLEVFQSYLSGGSLRKSD